MFARCFTHERKGIASGFSPHPDLGSYPVADDFVCCGIVGHRTVFIGRQLRGKNCELEIRSSLGL